VKDGRPVQTRPSPHLQLSTPIRLPHFKPHLRNPVSEHQSISPRLRHALRPSLSLAPALECYNTKPVLHLPFTSFSGRAYYDASTPTFLRLRLHGHNTLPRHGATNHSNVTRTDFAMTRPRYDAMKPCILDTCSETRLASRWN
jgi:hypothetical protein